MSTLRTFALVAAALVAALIVWPRGATADKPDKPDRHAPAECPQWEVMLAPAMRLAVDTKSLPEAGKPMVERAPAGWEPFAYTPSGALVYRRCAR